MELSSEFIRIEVLFNAVEQELARRWILHDVPTHFTHRPVRQLRQIVKAWWQIYHEAICADQAMNRTFWESKAGHPVPIALDTPALLSALEEIQKLADLTTLSTYRSIRPAEEAAICLLVNMTVYYRQPFSEKLRAWITNFVIFAPMEEQNLPLELTNEQLKAAALRYIAVLSKAVELLPSANQSLLTGTTGVTYLKLKGHKPLSEEDTEKIIQSLGTDDDAKAIRLFPQAQDHLSKRLTNNKWIVLIAEQSKIPYWTMKRRISKPSGWKADEMIQVAEVLQRLQV